VSSLTEGSTFLGHIVSPEGVSSDLEKLKAVKEWPTPKNKPEIRSLLRLLQTVHFRFRQYCKTADTTYRAETILPVDSRGGAAFQTLKGDPCAVPILTYRHPGERFFVDTEASNVGSGGVLFQVQDGQERVIA
jgi:hypothetical protein